MSGCRGGEREKGRRDGGRNGGRDGGREYQAGTRLREKLKYNVMI